MALLFTAQKLHDLAMANYGLPKKTDEEAFKETMEELFTYLDFNIVYNATHGEFSSSAFSFEELYNVFLSPYRQTSTMYTQMLDSIFDNYLKLGYYIDERNNTFTIQWKNRTDE